MPERRRLTRLAERIGLALALVGVLAVLAWMISLSKANSERAAEERARRVASVEQCYAEAATAPGLHDVLTAVEIITRNQLDHLLVHERDRVRTKHALSALQSFHAQATATAPTVAECKVLADRLGVQRTKATDRR